MYPSSSALKRNSVRYTFDVPKEVADLFVLVIQHLDKFVTVETVSDDGEPEYIGSDNVYEKPFLFWRDIAELFNCGHPKALAIMETVGKRKMGSSWYVLRKDLDAYIEEHGTIEPTYPERRCKRRRS